MSANASRQPAPAITIDLDRPLVRAGGRSKRYLVVTVRAPDRKPAAPDRQPLNLGVVIDVSGSMTGTPLAAAKEATLEVVEHLAVADHMSLTSFCNYAVRHASALPLTTGRRELGALIRGLEPRGGTNLSAGWLDGCTAVAERLAGCGSRERNHVMLLSDGHANDGIVDPVELARHADELRTRGIVTSTIGIGSGYSPTQLQAIAEAGGGRMHDAESPDEISRIMMAEFEDTLATTVENMTIELRLPEGVNAEPVGTARCTPTDTGVSILLGSMIGGTTRQLVVRLRLPAGRQGKTLAVGVSARWNAAGDSTVTSRRVGKAEMTFATAQACHDQPRSRSLTMIVARQWIADVYRRAMILNQDGEEAAAASLVDRARQSLLRFSAGIAELEAEIGALRAFSRSVSSRYSAETSKEMMLKAYKTSRGEVDHRGRADMSFEMLTDGEESLRQQGSGPGSR